MTEVLAVFRSRAQAMDCNSRLRKYGVPCNLINTPAEANIGCGLSVKFSLTVAPKAKQIISAARYSAFYGFFNMVNRYGRIIFVKN